MRQRALHSAAGTTRRAAADGRQRPVGQAPTRVESDDRTAPNAFDLPASPTPDHGLVPSGTSVTTVDDAPLSAIRSQRFAAVPVSHDVRLVDADCGVRLTATLTNQDEEPWGYRVPRGPAPFAGGRSTTADGELRLTPLDGEHDADGLFSDGALAPGESVRSTLAVSALGNETPRWPEGEHAFLQPLSVWTDEVAYDYNWQVTLLR